MRRRTRGTRRIGAILLGIGLAGVRLPAARLPGKWDIQLIVEAEGRYGLEGREARWDGTYALRARWVGLLEKDDEDFILIHKEWSLEKWEAEERAAGRETVVLLKTDDFGDKPELRVHYV